MVGHQVLVLGIGVRIPVPEQILDLNSFYNILFQSFSSPNAKFDASFRIHPITNRDNGFQRIHNCFPLYFAIFF